MKIIRTISYVFCAGLLINYANNHFNPTEHIGTIIQGTTDEVLLKYYGYNDVLIIGEGMGGSIDGTLDVINYIKKNDKMLIIDGPCFSACTLYLSSPNVRFTAKARFAFHTSYIVDCDGRSPIYERSKTGNKRMYRLFKPKLQEWLKEVRAFESYSFTVAPDDLIQSVYSEKFITESIIPSYNITYESPINKDDTQIPYSGSEDICDF